MFLWLCSVTLTERHNKTCINQILTLNIKTNFKVAFEEVEICFFNSHFCKILSFLIVFISKLVLYIFLFGFLGLTHIVPMSSSPERCNKQTRITAAIKHVSHTSHTRLTQPLFNCRSVQDFLNYKPEA